jgi:hypothetical protein
LSDFRRFRQLSDYFSGITSRQMSFFDYYFQHATLPPPAFIAAFISLFISLYFHD